MPIAAFLGVLMIVGSTGKTGASRAEPPPYRLTAISLVGYDPRSNKMLPDLSDHSWNQLDFSLLAAVEIVGQPGSFSPSRSVRIRVLKGGKTILEQRRALGVLEERSGRYYVPVWISGPFCEDLVIRASLLGQKEPSTAESKLEFSCGE